MVFLFKHFKQQYCLKPFPESELSLDHVIPKSMGGNLTWTNIVCACNECNYKKGAALPEELPALGMKLNALPRQPTYNEIQYKGGKSHRISQYPKDWRPFL